MKLLAAVLVAIILCMSSAAQAQCTGQAAPGNIAGNPTLAQAPCRFAAPGAFGILTTTLPSANILVGSSANLAAPVPMTGDISITNLGLTTLVAGSASNLNSGTLPSGRLTGFYTGLTGVGTLTAGATGAGFTVAFGTATFTGQNAVANGGTGLSAGTSGGVLAFTAPGVIASSGALTANLPVIGGGAGAAPTVGTRSGNTTQFVTTTGAQTSGNCVSIDANGNHVAAGAPCVAGLGNPTNPGVNLVGSNGIATTAMRSDAVLVLDQSIAPTMTGLWVFTPTSPTGPAVTINQTSSITGTTLPGRPGLYDKTIMSGTTSITTVMGLAQGYVQPKNLFLCGFAGISAFDSVNATAISGNPVDVPCLVILDDMGGGSQIGSRSSLNLNRLVSTNPSTSTVAGNDYFPQILLTTNVSARTGSSGSVGNYYGIGVQMGAASGATNLRHLNGIEIDITAQAGSSMDFKTGITMVNFNSDAVHGGTIDAAFYISATGDSIAAGGGFNTLFQLGGAGNEFPLTVGGSIFKTDSSLFPTLLVDGFDLSDTSLSFSGCGFKARGGYCVASSGIMTAPSVNLLGTSNQLVFQSGGVTGTMSWTPSSTNKTLTWPNGTTDFTSTGGTSQVLKQVSTGAAFTVARLACADLSNAAATCSSATAGILTVGSTTISSGTATRVLYDNAGVLGEYATVPVANGGTGLASGTSGGVLAFTASGTIASSGALAANQIVLGGGSGAAPTALGSLGTTATVLHGNAAGAPSFGAVVSADLNITTTSCSATNFVSAISSGGVGTCSVAAGGVTGLANPTNPGVNMTGSNGTATTAMRSDAILAINPAITPTWTGLWTFTPTSPTGPAITLNQTASVTGTVFPSVPGIYNKTILSGTTSATTTMLLAQGYVQPKNLFLCGYSTTATYDTVNAPSISSNPVDVPCLVIVDDMGGGSQLGSRSSLSLNRVVASNPSTSTVAGNDYFPQILLSTTVAARTGSSGSVGNYYGIGVQMGATSAGTNLSHLNGIEIDMTAQAGSSMAYKTGLTLSYFNNDAVHGSTVDAAFFIVATGDAIAAGGGVNRLFQLGGGGSEFPITVGGSIFKTDSSLFPTLLVDGFDLSDTSLSFSGCGFKARGGFCVASGGGMAAPSVTSTSLIGSTAAGAVSVVSKTTTGAGASDLFLWVGGNNGGTTFGQLNAVGMTLPDSSYLLWGAGTTGIQGSSSGGFVTAVTGSTVRGLFNSTGLTVTGSVAATAASGYLLGSAVVLNTVTNYTAVSDSAGGNNILLGNATDKTNFYSNDAHVFRNRATTVLATINATGLFINNVANVSTTRALCWDNSTFQVSENGTVGTCTVSDGRFKNEVGQIVGALDKLLQIRGLYFTWKDQARDGAGLQIGVIAQDVQHAFPELVSIDDDGKMSADYQRLVAPVIEAMRELKADNDNLHQEVDLLKKVSK